MSTELLHIALTGRRFEAAQGGGSLRVRLVRWVAAAVATFDSCAVRRDASWRSSGVHCSGASVRSWLCSWVVFFRSRLRSASRQRCGGMFEFIARSGFLFGGLSPLVATPSSGWPNNALVPTCKSEALLLAAQRGRWALRGAKE